MIWKTEYPKVYWDRKRILIRVYVSKTKSIIFAQWSDFADYVTKENGRGKTVTIHGWEYVDVTVEED